MSRAILVLSTFALFAVAVSGCLGGDEPGSGLPTARATVTEGADEYTFIFDATGSSGTGLAYSWDFGDQTTATDARVEHEFPGDDTYDVSLVITDKDGTTSIWTKSIKVGTGINNPPEATFSLSSRYLAIGEALTVDARKTTDIDDFEFTYQWDFNFPFNQNDYLKFREAKMNAEPDADGSSGSETGNESGDEGGEEVPTTAPDVPSGSDVYGTVTGLLGPNKDGGHAGHGGATDPVSFEIIQAETTDPVYTLTEGFPEATVFYVKLVVKDVKGGFQEIVSEEIFPVKVVATKEDDSISDNTSGSFTLGGPSTLTDNTPDVEGVPYDDEAADDQAWSWTVPKPIIDGAIHVNWSAVSDDASASSLEIRLDTESGKTRSVNGPNNQTTGGITLRLTEDEELGTGKWTLSVWARMGVQIEWTAEYAFSLDLNPFRDIEAPYV